MTRIVMVSAGLGLGIGVGMWALVVWLIPPRAGLGAVIARSATPHPPRPTTDANGQYAIIRPAIAALRAVGLPSPRLRADLIVLGRSVDEHLVTKIISAVGGFLLPAVGAVLLAVLGVNVGVPGAGVVVLGCAAVGFLIPDIRVRRAAERRRADFRHALSAYVDLVVISLAGGAGVDSALTQSAAVGDGWAFNQLGHALAAARVTRTTPWSTLRQLSDDLAIPELAELAASASLAGTEGAKVRQSLAAKAASLRTHQLTDTEGQAASNTERMSLPLGLVFLGFLTFIAYPATQSVLNGL